MIAAELAILPRIFEARTYGALMASGIAGTVLGVLSYQLFNHHKQRKHLDERWLHLLESRYAQIPLHAPREVIEQALATPTTPGDSHAQNHNGSNTMSRFERWASAGSATALWNRVMLAGTILPLVLMCFRTATLWRYKRRARTTTTTITTNATKIQQ